MSTSVTTRNDHLNFAVSYHQLAQSCLIDNLLIFRHLCCFPLSPTFLKKYFTQLLISKMCFPFNDFFEIIFIAGLRANYKFYNVTNVIIGLLDLGKLNFK
jgi:hypothetical protein